MLFHLLNPQTSTVQTTEAVTLAVNHNGDVISSSESAAESYSSFITSTRTHNSVVVATIALTDSTGGVTSSAQTSTVQTTDAVTLGVKSNGEIVTADNSAHSEASESHAHAYHTYFTTYSSTKTNLHLSTFTLPCTNSEGSTYSFTTDVSTFSEFVTQLVTDTVTLTATPTSSVSTKIVTQITTFIEYTDTYITSYSTVTVGGNGAKSSFLTTDTVTSTSSSSSVYDTTTTSVVQVIVTPSGYAEALAAASQAATESPAPTTPAESDQYVDFYTTLYVTSYASLTTDADGNVSSVFVEPPATTEELSTSSASSSITTVTFSTTSSSSSDPTASSTSSTSTKPAGPQVVTVDVDAASTQYVYATVHKRADDAAQTATADFTTVLVDNRELHEAEVSSVSQGGANKIGATFIFGFAGLLVVMF
ncbi:unnamed protein product [Ambrosiozyma monospora]|uniref:Unnamed protein product n=1 Tax=Ambrosiozyma monospora TaxID=43982 RepID=A0A9W6YSY3_AMBMO|nr:unnamed protein product [Ambrosiozyma monospora]